MVWTEQSGCTHIEVLYFASGLRRGPKGGEEGLQMLDTSIISDDMDIGVNTGCNE